MRVWIVSGFCGAVGVGEAPHRLGVFGLLVYRESLTVG